MKDSESTSFSIEMIVKTAVEALDDWLQPAWLLDGSFNVVHANQALLDLVGVSTRDEWAMNWQSFVHPEDLPGVEKAWLEASTTKRPHSDQRRMRNSHGQYRWMSAQTLPASFDASGRVGHWVGMAIDIHEEKTSTERLKRLQRLTADLSGAATSQDVATRILDYGMTALEATRAAVTLVSEDESRQEPLHTVNYPDAVLNRFRIDQPRHSTPLSEVLNRKQTEFFPSRAATLAAFPGTAAMLGLVPQQQALLVLPLIAKERTIGGLVFAYDTCFDADPSFLKFAEAIADLCAQALERSRLFELERLALAEAELERRRLASVLVEQVEARRELEENRAKLSAAKEDAEAANRAKTAFVANMSHEFRTPLSAILGFSEFLASDQLSAAKRTYFVEGIRRNGQTLLKLVDDILDLSRVEAGKINIEVQSFAPKFLIKDAIALFKDEAAKKNIKVALKGVAHLPATFASDPIRLRQILLNLIGNGIKFTEHGAVTVEVLRPMEPETLEICVHDTGIGITPEQATRLFQPFGQADRHTRRKYGGTGLGLFISCRLAQALEGDLTLRTSEANKGSTFLLKIKNLESQKAQAWVTTSETSGPTMTDLRGRRVLVVEDTRDLRNLLRAHLERAGADVDVAKDGRDGLIQASDGQHDLVLMDLSMPVMDGYTATLQLRKDGYRQPIVAITAHAHPEDRARCFEFGFDAYLTKPLNLRELETTIRRLLARVQPTGLAVKTPFPRSGDA